MRVSIKSWTVTDAGPLQVSKVAKLIDKLDILSLQSIEEIPRGDGTTMTMVKMVLAIGAASAVVNPRAVELHAEVFARAGGTITRANAKRIAADLAAAIPIAEASRPRVTRDH